MIDSAMGGPVRQVRRVGDVIVIDAQGEMTLACEDALVESVTAALEQRPRRVAVNFADVGFVDSTGVAVLVKLLSRAKKLGVELFFFAPSEQVRSILQVTRLDQVFTIYKTEAAALGE